MVGCPGWRGVGVEGAASAIYCRISKARDEDQTGVDRQERLCREVWDALLEAIRAGRVRHVIVYHLDRLMRQPRHLEELLTLSEEHDITLHGQANRRELSDPDDRFFLRIEVAHVCRSSDDTSRRLRDALEDRAWEGRVHAGAKRPYGYAPGGMVIIEDEGEVVREVCPLPRRRHSAPDRLAPRGTWTETQNRRAYRNLAAHKYANELREQGDEERIRQVEIHEAERTVRALKD
jgi:Resolvase, N terminal domain